VHGSVTIEQFLSDLAAQGDAVGVKPADFNPEKPVERDFFNQLISPRALVFICAAQNSNRPAIWNALGPAEPKVCVARLVGWPNVKI
jgi:hypothetical protein